MKNEKQHFQREKNDTSYLSPLIFKKWTLKSHKDRTREQRSAPTAKKTFSKDRTHNFFFNPRKLKHSKNLLGKN